MWTKIEHRCSYQIIVLIKRKECYLPQSWWSLDRRMNKDLVHRAESILQIWVHCPGNRASKSNYFPYNRLKKKIN